MNKKIKILTTMVVLASAFWVLFYTNAQNSQINLSITAGTNTFNTSGSITLPSRTSSFTAVSKDTSNGTFQANSFVAQDLKWTDAWSITVASTDLTGPNWTINSWNIYMKVSTAIAITWDVTCGANTPITSSWTWLNTTRILLQKTAANWKVCKVAVTPTIWVDIPASQAIGAYVSTINIVGNAISYAGGLTY